MWKLVLFLCAGLGVGLFVNPLSWGSSEPGHQISPGLTYSDYTCLSNGSSILFHEVQWSPGEKYQLSAIRNKNAIQNPNCSGGYGGQDLIHMIEKLKKERKDRFSLLAATNGTFFRTVPKKGGQTGSGQIGYSSIGMLWAKTQDGASGGEIFEKFRMKGGSDVLVVDARGAHRLAIRPEICGSQTCVSINKKNKNKMTTQSFIRFLSQGFPSATLAAQMNMDLSGGHMSSGGKLTHYSECKENPDKSRVGWKCKSLPRTVFCGKANGTLSLLTSPSAYVYDLAVGLRPGGACHTDCQVLFNLDGGRSTQMAVLDSSSQLSTDKKFNDKKFNDKKFKFLGAYDSEWRTVAGTLPEESACGTLRPVDNYFIVERLR